MAEKWDGVTERRKSPKGLTAFEEIEVLHNQFLAVSDRITEHKKDYREGIEEIKKLFVEENKKIRALLISEDGEHGIIPRLKVLEQEKGQRDKQTSQIMTTAYAIFTAFVIMVIGWLGKAILALIKLMGG